MVDIIIPTYKSQYAVAPMVCDIEGYSLGCRAYATCKDASASINRNIGLEWAQSDIVIMMDDDISGFYDLWWQELIEPLKDKDIYMVSARLIDRYGNNGQMMFQGALDGDYATVPRVPSACIAFRKDDIRFNEKFIGSGYEDDDFCAQKYRKHPNGKCIINNKVRLTHLNEMKNQNHPENGALFHSLWRTLEKNTVRVDMYYNIPPILHFVWIGSDLPLWAAKNIDEFKRLNPDFEVMIHKEDMLLDCFIDHFKKKWVRWYC